MIPSLILLALLGTVGLVLWLLDRHSRDDGTADDTVGDTAAAAADDADCTDSCCAVNTVCPSEMLLRAEASANNYYDDEELDAYRGRADDEYTDDELEQWRDVLYTLRPEDRLGWERAVKRRGLVMPAVIRDELVMLAGEMQ